MPGARTHGKCGWTFASAATRAKRVPGALAIWGAASACALILAGLYFGYSVLLGASSDPVARELENYWMARQQNKPAADLEKLLVQLDQKFPNDGKVLETLFNHGIDFGNLKLAADACELP